MRKHVLVVPVVAAIFIAAAAACAVGVAAADALSFTPPIDYGVGGRPVDLAAADVNGDGRPDIVASAGDGISILLWKGSGRFTKATHIALEHRPGAVALADVNGDRAADVVTACGGDDTVTVLLGDGAGSFVARGTYPTAKEPWDVVVGDMTGDGAADVATADIETGAVSILRGDGSGALLPPIDLPTGDACSRLLCADFDLDGIMDLAYNRYSWEEYAGFGILLADGAGGFTPMGTYETGWGESGPHALALADLNSDERPDLAVLQGYEGGTVWWFLGDGLGIFINAGRKDFIGGLADAVGFAVADVDRRFGDDFVTAAQPESGRPTRIYVLRRTAWNTLGFESTWFYARRTVGQLVAADFNGDRRPDLAWTDRGSDNVSVRLNGALPVLTGVSPARGRIGAVITLTGRRFLKRGGTVQIGGRTATRYLSWSNTRIRVRLPGGTPKGRVTLTVTTVIGRSAPRYFSCGRRVLCSAGGDAPARALLRVTRRTAVADAVQMGVRKSIGRVAGGARRPVALDRVRDVRSAAEPRDRERDAREEHDHHADADPDGPSPSDLPHDLTSASAPGSRLQSRGRPRTSRWRWIPSSV
jgi:hypothetical protein